MLFSATKKVDKKPVTYDGLHRYLIPQGEKVPTVYEMIGGNSKEVYSTDVMFCTLESIGALDSISDIKVGAKYKRKPHCAGAEDRTFLVERISVVAGLVYGRWSGSDSMRGCTALDLDRFLETMDRA
jgi:hypothetical protein